MRRVLKGISGKEISYFRPTQVTRVAKLMSLREANTTQVTENKAQPADWGSVEN
jgi:hypothetical protein